VGVGWAGRWGLPAGRNGLNYWLARRFPFLWVEFAAFCPWFFPPNTCPRTPSRLPHPACPTLTLPQMVHLVAPPCPPLQANVPTSTPPEEWPLEALVAKLRQYCYLMEDLTPENMAAEAGGDYEKMRGYLRWGGWEAGYACCHLSGRPTGWPAGRLAGYCSMCLHVAAGPAVADPPASLPPSAPLLTPIPAGSAAWRPTALRRRRWLLPRLGLPARRSVSLCWCRRTTCGRSTCRPSSSCSRRSGGWGAAVGWVVRAG
jgi:hypothetical protein